MRDRIEDLRAAFARGFAEAPAAGAQAEVELLRIRLAGESYVCLLAEISGLHADLAIVPMPSPSRALLGIAAVRSALVPVYDLRVALGLPAGERPRWLVIGRAAPTLAFAFDAFDGYCRAGVGGNVVIDGRHHQLLDLAALHRKVRA